MNEEKILLWQLQTVFFFVKNYGYGLLEVVGHNQGDFWLINNKNKKYSVIRVSSLAYSISGDNQTKNINSMVGKVMNNRQGHLSIYFGNEEINEPNTIVMSDVGYHGVDVSKEFPQLNDLLISSKAVIEDIPQISVALKEELKAVKNRTMNQAKHLYVTYGFIIICSFIYLLINILANDTYSTIDISIMFGAYYKILILAGEYFRLLTYGFVHLDLIHIMANLFSLYNLGRILEPLFGRMKFFITIILSIIGGGLLTYAINDASLIVGLSGGLYGLLGMIVVYYFNSGLIKNAQSRYALINTLIINVMISFLPNVGIYAHLGGFITGGLLGVLFTNNIMLQNLKKHVLISLIILYGVLIYKASFVSYSNLENIYPLTDSNIINLYRKINLNAYADNLEYRLIDIYNNFAGGKQ